MPNVNNRRCDISISVGDLLLKLGLDSSDFKKGMADAENSITSGLKKIQTELKIAGAVFTTIGVAGLKFASDARKLNADLAQTGITLGVSTKEMRNLALATTDVTFPLKSVTATFDLLARAGVKSTDEMKKSAKAFDALADATGSSAETVADMLIPVFRAFGQQIPTTTGELDKFTWLTKNTTVDLGDFATVVQRLAPEMQTAGVSMDDAVIALAALEAKGITGRKATMQLGDAITKAATDGTSLATALGLTETEVSNYKAKLDEAKGSTDKYSDAAASQFGIMDKVKQTFSELTLRVGSLITPLEPLLGLMTALGPVMMFFSTSMGMAAVKTVLHTTALIVHNIAMIAVTIASKAWAAAQWLVNAAMSANPIGLIVIAIAALIAIIVLLVKNWDTVKTAFIAVWEAVKTAWNEAVSFFTSIWNGIVEVFKKYWQWILLIIFPAGGIVALFIKYWEPIVGFFQSLWNKVTGIFAAAWNGIVGGFKTAINGMLTGVEGFVNFFIRGINAIIGGLNKINFSLPSWIPGIGGKSFGVNIATIGEIKLPRLAEGGIVTGPTAAMIGEKGPEVVAPLDRLSPPANITYVTVKVGEQTLVDLIDRSLDRRKRIQQVI